MIPVQSKYQALNLRTSSSMFTISWGNWQYQAGVGNDPRSSRQFNPIKQAADYDGEGKYVRLWIPELKDVPDQYLQTPWCRSYVHIY
jgi:deoxyribodipyrimidine photolyase